MQSPCRPAQGHPGQAAPPAEWFLHGARMAQEILLDVNGERHALALEPRRTLLDVLRRELGLTGAKRACDMGNCGACTVHLDGRAVYACLTLAVDCEGRAVTTIEGLAKDGALDALQAAFVAADALQCGYCTPGQVMSLRALLNDNPSPGEEEIRRAVSGNLCRCGAYRNIVRAGIMASSEQKNSR